MTDGERDGLRAVVAGLRKDVARLKARDATVARFLREFPARGYDPFEVLTRARQMADVLEDLPPGSDGVR